MQWLLIKIRKEHKETQKDLAELLNISESAYGQKERGTKVFTGDEMFIIADHYKLGLSEIFLPTKSTKRLLNI